MAGGHSLNLKQGPGPRDPRHPLRIRPGQMFFPRRGRRRMRLTVKRIDGEWVRGIREDGSEVNLRARPALGRDPAAEGIHYRFLGWWLRLRGIGPSCECSACRRWRSDARSSYRNGTPRRRSSSLSRACPKSSCARRHRLLHGESGFSQRRRARHSLLSCASRSAMPPARPAGRTPRLSRRGRCIDGDATG